MLKQNYCMKNIAYTLIWILLFAVIGCSVAKSSDTPTSILWEVKLKSDTSKVAYLLGSIHIGKPGLYPLNPVIMNVWSKCDALSVEINILDINTAALFGDLSLIEKFISYTEKLSDKLPPDLYPKVKNALVKIGIPNDFIDVLTPLAAAMVLELGDASLFTTDSTDVVDGIDMYFLNQAKNENKPIYELETISVQVTALEKLNENIIQYLQTQIDKLDNTETDIDELFTAWKKGDVKSIENMINIPFSNDSEVNKKIMDALLYDRNIDMAKKIEGYFLQEKTFFVVVGSAHYIGQKSIIDILQKTGLYYIRRL